MPHGSIKPMNHPSYLDGVDLTERARVLKSWLAPCRVCPFRCGVDRFKESTGRCRMGYRLKVASWSLHFGEEPPISGERGSGTIFLSGCPMACVFCQNFPISQLCHGREMETGELASRMVELQRQGAHNINFVTPTHFVPQIVETLDRAVKGGLSIPIVYNSSGYDNVESLRMLEGIVDVYLPDMKYGDDERAFRYSGVTGYVKTNRAAVAEMYRQVGDLELDETGIAVRGLIVRHLVLPGGMSGTDRVLEFLAGLSQSIGVSLMSQYFPAHEAVGLPELGRKITRGEYEEALDILDRFGFVNGWVQSV
jgi:putative pyruvate formate lyase activating enzyme